MTSLFVLIKFIEREGEEGNLTGRKTYQKFRSLKFMLGQKICNKIRETRREKRKEREIEVGTI